jgi:decaprenylphospho-beta-D-ribofuranose 2-oxidase
MDNVSARVQGVAGSANRPCLTPERRLLSGWGGTPRSAADVYPIATLAELRDSLTSATVAGHGAIARGLGRSYGDAAQLAGGSVLDMTGMSGLKALDLVAGTVTAAAGMSLDTLMAIVLPHGFFVPVTPGTRFVTLGGAIASDIHGKNHHADGSLQRHLVSFVMQTPAEGEVTVTPESDPDLFAATAGGMGLTGIITEATIRLVPVETSLMEVDTERTPNLDAVLERLTASDRRYRYSVAWVDCLATGRSLGRSILMQANHATADHLRPAQRARPLEFVSRPLGTVPAWVPSGLVRTSTMRAFNEFWFRRAPRAARGVIEGIAPYFHPLDRIQKWNRGYGPRGFVQYQLAVPHGAEDTLRTIVEMLARRGCPSFVPVLKRFGAGCGMLSFPIAGWTLTFDLPVGVPELDVLLDSFDRLVADAGGRVYLAKDARMKPGVLREMYPDLERWRAVRARVDPKGVLASDLSRRLELT